VGLKMDLRRTVLISSEWAVCAASSPRCRVEEIGCICIDELLEFKTVSINARIEYFKSRVTISTEITGYGWLSRMNQGSCGQ